MKTHFDCLPCVIKTVAESIKLATDDKNFQREILFKLVEKVKNYKIENPPPEIAGDLFREIKEITGNNDPYREIKRYGNSLMLEHADNLEKK